MPVERQAPQKRRRLPFNPPRPRASASAGPSNAAPKSKAAKTSSSARTSTVSTSKSTKKSATSRKRATSPLVVRSASPESASGSQSASESASGSAITPDRARSPSQEPDFILAEIIGPGNGDDVDSSEPAIPPKLLTRLLHHHFQNEKTKIAKDANVAVSKYVDIFVREAVARAAYERAEGQGAEGGRSIGDGFLEVCVYRGSAAWATPTVSHVPFVSLTLACFDCHIGRRPGKDGTAIGSGFLMIVSSFLFDGERRSRRFGEFGLLCAFQDTIRWNEVTIKPFIGIV